MNGLKPTDLAYLAGVFDGEGSIFIAYSRYGKKRFLYAMVDIASADKDWTFELQRMIGMGGIHKWSGNRAYHWRLVNQNKILMFLKAIRPYLKFKSEKADLMIQYCESRIALCNRLGNNNLAKYREEDFLLANKLRKIPISTVG